MASSLGTLVELVVPMRTLGAGIGDRVHVSGDLARYLCANGHAVLVESPRERERVVLAERGP